uniref:UDPgalactose transporter putative n=1 Tax=Albugo laibachii Nc14 TaxID=890382 RepID=F0WV05_9STRA|nr:UDPgalactose transporter putative [Albugo laibachii Nc14]|eukprot:CCA25241.1 UDPgalactose transporter putative [Albugo laibachii Nc14]
MKPLELSRTQTHAKYTSLCVLCLQNSLLAVIMRLSRASGHPQYNTHTAVLMGEVLKVSISAILIVCVRFRKTCRSQRCILERCDSSKPESSPFTTIFDCKEMIRISIPALMYVVQNNLQYVAISNLDAAVFQVLYQLKILSTAIFSVAIMGKSILPVQWISIIVLMLGVALVQFDESNESLHKNAFENVSKEQSTLTGLIAVVCACICSGFAGVYFEKILKHIDSKGTIWERNVQMGIVSILLASLGLFWQDREFLREFGFFYGYRLVVWGAITISAAGGLLTAIVVKYADNILKAFATSIATVLSVLMSILLFNKIPTAQFALGTLLVNLSVFAYGNAFMIKKEWTPLPRLMSSLNGKKIANA